MLFSISHKVLIDAIKEFSSILTSDKDEENWLYFTISNQNIKISGKNNLVFMEKEINSNIKIKKNDSFLINGKLLINIINKLTQNEIEFIKHDSNVITIKCEKFECNINLLSTENFTEKEIKKNTKKYPIAKHIFEQINKKFLKSDEKSSLNNFITQNVSFDSTRFDNHLEITSLNDTSVIYEKFSIKDIKNDINFSLNKEVFKFLNFISNEIEFSINDNEIYFFDNNTIFCVKIAEKQTQNIYGKLIDNQCNNLVAKLSTKKLINSLEKTLIFSNDKLNSFSLEFINNSLFIKNTDVKNGTITEELEFDGFMDNSKIIQGQNFLNLVKNITTDTIELKLRDDKRVVYVLEPDNKNYISLSINNYIE